MTDKDPYDQFWEWAEKPLRSRRKISSEIHHAVMALPPEARRDREKVNEAVRDKQERQVSEMIERVARAIDEVSTAGMKGRTDRQLLVACACAAIEAMRPWLDQTKMEKEDAGENC